MFQFLIPLLQFLWYANYTHDVVLWAMTYRGMLCIFAVIKRNHFKMYMFGVVGETHAHDYFKVISFYNSKDYNILWYIIARILCHLRNLHIKETEISQKRSKGIENWKITYSVILNVLSNKTNLILGFSSPLKLLYSIYVWYIAITVHLCLCCIRNTTSQPLNFRLSVYIYWCWVVTLVTFKLYHVL